MLYVHFQLEMQRYSGSQRTLSPIIERAGEGILRADYREGDEDSNSSIFRVRRSTEFRRDLTVGA